VGDAEAGEALVAVAVDVGLAAAVLGAGAVAAGIALAGTPLPSMIRWQIASRLMASERALRTRGSLRGLRPSGLPSLAVTKGDSSRAESSASSRYSFAAEGSFCAVPKAIMPR